MQQTLAHVDQAPQGVKDTFHEIDTLKFGSGFSHFTDKTIMQFGTARIAGVDAMKKFFIKIDAPLEIEHRIHDFWDGGSINILCGDAVLRKKDTDDEFITTPLMMIFYMTEDGEKVARWFIVNGPIKTDAVI